MRPAENTEDILVIYEQEAEEWALYLKSLFTHVVNEGGILLYNLETSSFKHQELYSLSCYKCKVLILSCGLLNCLNQKRSYFLERVLRPADNVVILLCGVENSEILYDVLTLDRSSQEISTDQEPEEYLSVVTGIIQTDHETSSAVWGASEETDFTFKTEVLPETSETNKQSILVLPGRISCENPGEIFILLREEIDDETLEIEFIADSQQTRLQPASWNEKVKYVKALDFPAGPVCVNVYCGGVIKATAQIKYYTALEDIEHLFKEVADPIAFTCQASKFSSVEKLDNVLTLLLKSKIPAYEFSPFQSEEECHQQANRHLEEFPTLLHCAARFGLKNLATFLLSRPNATWACKITNAYGDDPASIAEKHGHRELRKLMEDSSMNAVSNFTSCKEEAEDDDTYMPMLGSESQPATAKQHLGDGYGTGPRCQREAEVDEEQKDDAEDSREETNYEDAEEEDLYSSQHSPGGLHASTLDTLQENRRACFFFKRPPPPPPQNLPGSLRQDNLHSLSQERNELIADQESCETDGEEEHPYTSAELEESLYDFVLAEAEEEERKERRSFIINRPPAPAPRPVCSPVREENTPYIVQVFQQKATRVPCDTSRIYCHARKHAQRGHPGTSSDSAVKHSLPAEQEELIHLQEQVKRGAISVDEALDRFKQWQNENQRLQTPQQERVHHLRETSTGNRLEKETPSAPKESRPESIPFLDFLFHMAFTRAQELSGAVVAVSSVTSSLLPGRQERGRRRQTVSQVDFRRPRKHESNVNASLLFQCQQLIVLNKVSN
ncbi:B-cell scaffold protein with ankyrin repeats isoform X2 [Pogoniulus pusillus]|uniref:B-cell scaffold protein with ankyrin repeats isoform X2 n=1 Tax=Pogoniulus pusillus TaxID=488313 RepID=UPI0030B950F1